MTPKYQKKTSPQLKTYQELSNFEKTVLQVCAVISEPVQIEFIAACLIKYFAVKKTDRNKLLQNLEPTLEKLTALHFLDKNNQCVSSFVEIACRAALKKDHFAKIAAVVQHILPTTNTYLLKNSKHAYNRFVRDLRIDTYTSNIDHFNSVLLAYFNYPGLEPEANPVALICNNPFDAEWFSSIPIQIQLYALNEIYKDSLIHLKPVVPILPFLEKQLSRYKIPPEAKKSFAYLFTTQLILTGNTKRASTIFEKHKNLTNSLGLKGFLWFLQNKNTLAIEHYDADLTILRKTNENQNAYFTGMEGLMFIVAMLKSGDFSFLEIIKNILTSVETIQPNNLFKTAYTSLRFVVEALENRLNLKSFQQHIRRIHEENSISVLFAALAAQWITGNIPEKLVAALSKLFRKAHENDYKWLALEYLKLLDTENQNPKMQQLAKQLQNDTNIVPLTRAVTFEEPWQRALKALLHSTAGVADKKTKKTRLAWHINYNDDTKEITCLPKEQKHTSKGLWTKGRSISLKKLYTGNLPDYLTDKDKKICGSLFSKENAWGTSYHFDPEIAIPALIGHPYVFLDNNEEQVEIIKGAPELRVNDQNGIFELRFYPQISEKQVVLVQESATRFKVYEISAEHRRVAYIIGENGLNVPEEAKDEVLSVLGNVSSFMTVHSDIHGKADVIHSVTADPTIYIHLLPYSSGLRVTLYVKPFKIGGPYLKPGRGTENVIAEIDGQRLQSMRDLNREAQNAIHLEENCHFLACCENTDKEWLIQNPENCLEILLELQRLGDDFIIEWPEGEKFTVSRQISTDQFHVHIRKKNDWFQVDGELAIDDDLVLDMHKLLELTKTTSGRFIPVGDGQFLTLTEELRKRIDELRLYSDQKSKTLRINPLAAIALEDFTKSGIQLEADINWHDQIKKVSEAHNFNPVPPSTLHAELRDYQIEGYTWLARMAFWGVGACLADDMGLGKTVQALAVILDRAPQGPTLIVAPTSVCLNWKTEANRFAPTLNINLFTGRKRKKLVNNLKEFDVLIVSYALLQQESELLTNINWQTIVLDEAQAIKNMATKRSRAAMSLQGKFKLITTGTPIENHLGELWNLFNFINPGLLGSYRQFVNRFIMPIERHNNRDVRNKLKKLIRPFLLRRIKSQVLEELPPRTEITLHVEMDKKEAALYEALRMQALETIQSDSTPGRKHLTILAQITRLRRACCNPSLVVPGTTIRSAKLDLFGKVIDELLENRHKALIFSQFVGHLSILRTYLDRKSLSYRYIDGNTSPKNRQQEVELFQSGEGDLFLISLKAGGLGLNLTAADYVIHMDPWWNPAVEDQASDRAHRIGQQHPVTVYRLVTKNTIEEKIIALHQEKRDLADSLLEGADISNKISADELLTLLQDQ
jgi:SNF2 family DNA or RNA helicase